MTSHTSCQRTEFAAAAGNAEQPVNVLPVDSDRRVDMAVDLGLIAPVRRFFISIALMRRLFEE